MDRETILKHSKAVRLEHKLLTEFTDLIAEYCTIKGSIEHLESIIKLLQHPAVNTEIINTVLEYFEKEYHIIKLEKINTINNVFGSMENKQLINIY